MNSLTQKQVINSIKLPESPSQTENSFAFSLAAKQMIIRAQRSDKDENKEIIANSLKYQVLSTLTALFGKIKNKEKSQEEMKTVEIAVRNYRDLYTQQQANASYSYGGFRSLGRGKPSAMMNCKKKMKGNPRMRQASGMAMKKSTVSKPQSSVLKEDLCFDAAPLRSMCTAVPQSMMKRELGGHIADDAFDPVESSSDGDEDMRESKEKVKRKSRKKEKKSQKGSESEPIASTGYDALINSQDFSGFFSLESCQTVSKADFTSIPELITAKIPDSKDQEKIWYTIIALAILTTQYAEKEGEWTLIAKKAKTYLKKQGFKSDMKELLSLAKALI